MNNFDLIGRWLIVGGLVIIGIGIVIILLGRIPGIEKYPGTIRIEFGGMTCIFPLLFSIVLSIVLTLILNLVSRLFH